MAVQNQQQANADGNGLPDPQASHDLLSNQVHARVFFGKLAADYGEAPRTPAEARQLLELGARLRMAKQSEVGQQLEAADSPYGPALADLDAQLTQLGIDTGVKSAAAREFELAVNGEVERLAASDAIYNAVLSVKVAEAGMLAQRYGVSQPAA